MLLKIDMILVIKMSRYISVLLNQMFPHAENNKIGSLDKNKSRHNWRKGDRQQVKGLFNIKPLLCRPLPLC